jgi:predicted dehydrogenase
MTTIAIIGAGAMAREHLRAFSDIAGVSLRGIFSRTRSKAETLAAEFSIPQVCDAVDDLYERTQADLVINAASAGALKPTTLDCLRYPWLIFMEKPPGLNVQETRELQAAADGRTVLVGLNRRFLSSTRAVLAGLSDSPRHIHVHDQQDLEMAARLHPPEIVANWMYGNSIHLVDYLRFLGRGQIVSVTPVFPWHPANPGVVVAGIQFEQGDTGIYEGIWNGPGPWGVSVSTPEARWELRPLEEGTLQKRGERVRSPIDIHPWDKTFKPGFRAQAEQVICAVRGEPLTVPTLHDAAETMRLIEAIFR